jgi:hypothetical protein
VNHGSYIGAQTNVVVRVTETIAPDATGTISYESDQQGYRGFLKYQIENDVEFGSSLCIPTMNADPNGQSLGAVLIWIAANSATFRNCKYMIALGVFGPAQPFYTRCGFYPSQHAASDLAVRAQQHNWNDTERAAMFSSILKWGGKTTFILDKSYNLIKNLWVPVPPQ